MKIEVNRTNTSEGNLVFTITVSEPHHSFFGVEEIQIFKFLDMCKEDIVEISSEDNKTRIDAISYMHLGKERAFNRILENLKFAITNELEPKFKPMCQEIYNWIYDHQKDELKSWMTLFDPQRTRYYFDNDVQRSVHSMAQTPQESEHDEDDESDYDEDED